MCIQRQALIAALVGLAGLASLTTACQESSAPPDPPPTGAIKVVVATTGSELDADGYAVSVDSGSARVVGVNASTSFVGLEIGSHVVQLGGLAGNCGVSGSARRTLDVAADDTVAAVFAISCIPNVSLHVTIATTGSGTDADGYVVKVDDAAGQPIAVNGFLDFTGLSAGQHTVSLSGLAAGCTLGSANPLTITVTTGHTTSAALSVTCTLPPPPPPNVSLRVTTATTGSGTDADGYVVQVDDAAGQSIAISGFLDFTGLSVGQHTVTLGGLAAGCAVSTLNPLTITVSTGQTTGAAFSVTCTLPPPPSNVSLHVTTATTGSAFDADGYVLQVDAAAGQAIGVNGSLDFTGLSAGQHTVTLSGLAAGCAVTTPNPLTIAVSAGQASSAAFSVTCTAPGGTVKISTVTTGVELDPDGYRTGIDASPTSPIPANGTVTLTGISTGSHTVTLAGASPNCIVSGNNPREITVTAGTTLEVVFTIVCGATGMGTVKITTVTTGAELDPDGYQTGIDVEPNGASPIETNGTITLTGISAGSHTVTLAGASLNCDITGSNPRTITVASGTTVEVAFSIVCVATGSVQVTAATSGIALDPDGYSFDVVRSNEALALASGSVPTNGAATATGLRPGSYVVTLHGFSANCSPADPRTVVVTGGSTVVAAFTITCGPLAPLAFVNVVLGNAYIFVVEPDGSRARQVTTKAAADYDPAWSPDGRRIVFTSIRDGNPEIYVMNPDGSNPERLTSNPASDSRPAWSPDGQKIAFVSDRDGDAEIYVMRADGTSPIRVTNHVGSDGDPAWSPDSRKIAFVRSELLSRYVDVMNADGSALVQLTAFRGGGSPAWSPDGTRIAFSSTGFGSSSFFITVMNADGSNISRLVYGSGPLADPTWSPDSRKIAYSLRSCDFYSYRCSASIKVVEADGSGTPRTAMPGSNPAWRP